MEIYNGIAPFKTTFAANLDALLSKKGNFIPMFVTYRH